MCKTNFFANRYLVIYFTTDLCKHFRVSIVRGGQKHSYGDRILVKRSADYGSAHVANKCMVYRFRCLDTDGDGVLSGYELSQFWEEQEARFLS